MPVTPHQDPAPGRADSPVETSAHPQIGVVDHFQAGVLRSAPSQDGEGPIGAPPVCDHHLDGAFIVLVEDSLQGGLDVRGLVAHRHDHRDVGQLGQADLLLGGEGTEKCPVGPDAGNEDPRSRHRGPASEVRPRLLQHRG